MAVSKIDPRLYEDLATLCLYMGGDGQDPVPVQFSTSVAAEIVDSMVPRPLIGDKNVDVDVDCVHIAYKGWRLTLWLGEEMGTREMTDQWGPNANSEHDKVIGYNL